MSAYPIVLDGEALRVLVVGGGGVAARKVRGLLAAGAGVRVVAPTAIQEIRDLAAQDRVVFTTREYTSGDIGEAMLVVAATNDRAVNARVAADARRARRLVNVADRPGEGNCATVASHRAGDVLVSVYAGGVPEAAARIRDAVAERIGPAFGGAVSALAALRTRLLDAGAADGWARARGELLDGDFCRSVESGGFLERVARWE